MDPKVVGEAGVLLGSLGAAMQGLRQFKAFPEWAYYVVAGAVTLFGCYLVDPALAAHWKSWLLEYWPIVVTLFGAFMAGTKAASDGSKAIAAAKPNLASLMPVTNSK